MSDRVCLITGAGPGTGASLCRRFAEGYQVAMIARNEQRLKELEKEIPGSRGYVCDVTDQKKLISVVDQIKNELGPPEVAIHNAARGSMKDFMEIDPEELNANFQVNTMALLYLAKLVAPDMVSAGKGVILCTGNTSAHRGIPKFAGFAPTKAAQRILLESIARSLGPQGIHVAYITIDAVIDSPWQRKRRPEVPDSFYCLPEDIADECWHIAHQAPSAWSFNVEVRPPGEKW